MSTLVGAEGDIQLLAYRDQDTLKGLFLHHDLDVVGLMLPLVDSVLAGRRFQDLPRTTPVRWDYGFPATILDHVPVHISGI